MYQDKVPNKVVNEILNSQENTNKLNIYRHTDIDLLTFEPSDILQDVCAVARDILINRVEDDLKLISKAINAMLVQGEKIAHNLLRYDSQRQSVYVTDSRQLYLLHHYYDLQSVGIQSLTWAEIFATLALMQCAAYSAQEQQIYDDSELGQALKQSADFNNLLFISEITDTIARAECLFDNKYKIKKTAQAGGKGKAENYKPLKDYVLRLYLEEFFHHSDRKASRLILEKMKNDNNPLLYKSYSEDKAQEFTRWIGQFRKGKLKISVKN